MKTYLQEHEIILTFRNAIAERIPLRNATFGCEPRRPPSQLGRFETYATSPDPSTAVTPSL